MAETKDPVQLRLLSLELLKQLWAGHEAMCRSVARAASGVGGHLGNVQVGRKDNLSPVTMSKPPGSPFPDVPISLMVQKLRPWEGGRDWAGIPQSHSRVKIYGFTAGQSGWALARLLPG